MAYYITRTAQMTQAVNTYSNAGGLAGAGPTDITVPQGVSKIVQIIFSLGRSATIVASAGGNILLRLTGNGLSDGQQDLTVYGLKEGATDTAPDSAPPAVMDVDISVKPGNSVQPAFAYTGVDPGTPEAAVTLVFA